jgi:hypothetical protein
MLAARVVLVAAVVNFIILVSALASNVYLVTF